MSQPGKIRLLIADDSRSSTFGSAKGSGTWATQNASGYRVPIAPDIVAKEDQTVRQPAEAALTLLLCPGAAFTPEQLALLKQSIAQVDYPKAVMYGLYYTQAVYWRAVRLGLLKLPSRTGD
jgi:hypothetical protein